MAFHMSGLVVETLASSDDFFSLLLRRSCGLKPADVCECVCVTGLKPGVNERLEGERRAGVRLGLRLRAGGCREGAKRGEIKIRIKIKIKSKSKGDPVC